jgi:hypothetical protein
MVFEMLLCGEFTKTFVERWIVCTSLGVNVFITLTTEYHLEYHCKAVFETPYITSGSRIEP